MSDIEADVSGNSISNSERDAEQRLADIEPTLHLELGISLQGFADEKVATELGNAIHYYLWHLSKLFNLERLIGVTVSWDYSSALARLDRGIETSTALTPTDDGLATGVAMTPLVIRNGEPKSHMVLHAAFVSPITDESHELHRQAIYLVAHEAAHAHELAHECQIYPETLLKPMNNYRDFLLFNVARTSWEEFSASCLSSGFAAPEQLGYYENTFCTKLEEVREKGNASIRAYRLHRDVGRLLGEMVKEYGDLLKYASYLLGHIHGKEFDFALVAPRSVTLIEQRLWFKEVFKKFQNCLQQMWDTYQDWAGVEIYEPLKQIVHDLLEIAGIRIIEQPVGVYVEVPYTAETLPEF